MSSVVEHPPRRGSEEELREAAVIASKGESEGLPSHLAKIVELAFVNGAVWCREWYNDSELPPNFDK